MVIVSAPAVASAAAGASAKKAVRNSARFCTKAWSSSLPLRRADEEAGVHSLMNP